MEPLPPWPLTCLLLLALPGADAQVGQDFKDFKVQQLQDPVTVAAGQTITLTCTISGDGPAGPVRWLKGKDSGVTVYDQTGSSPRVTRAENGSDTDFSIHITDVQPEDAGTYYCVKFRNRLKGEEEFQRGKGTEVSVRAKPTRPVVSGPGRRVAPGESVPFTCVSGGFFPEEITVKWFKDKASISAQQPQITPAQTKSSYNMSSTVMLTLQRDDLRSNLSCKVQHPTLTDPLTGMFQLRDALRVPPSVRVATDSRSPVEVNETVIFTCDVEGFYPGDVDVTWLENRTEVKVEKLSKPVETPQGLFKLRSLLEVQATEEKNGSAFTCQVVHDGQAPVSETALLWISALAKGGQSDLFQTPYDNLLPIYIVVGVVCTVLALLVAAILYLIRAKQSKGKSSPSARLHEPEKSSEATTQESDPNNLTYADLNFEKERKTIRRMVEMSQQSEYACIQASRPPASDDNLTYADLDMVHLSKAPKRPAPCPEEATSEYASVQIPRK
ncbi:tyrosine-protein phosphatase non-receptor type substrate 1-like isoform X2 [Phaenicophaeus curvirostris]|uniref:tyrosine-protein phosphatase non-receptor type substrate 1-like isoform X2 n=1 Tax=Phaenicophaeus curvirostris TaxID=33595 RepID=UPI0037F0BB1E